MAASAQVVKARWRLFGHVLQMNENVQARHTRACCLYEKGHKGIAKTTFARSECVLLMVTTRFPKYTCWLVNAHFEIHQSESHPGGAIYNDNRGRTRTFGLGQEGDVSLFTFLIHHLPGALERRVHGGWN